MKVFLYFFWLLSIESCFAQQNAFLKQYAIANEGPYAFIQTLDSSFLMVGFTNSFGSGMSDFLAIKTTLQGDTIWTRAIGGTDIDYSYITQEITGNNYLILGSTKSFSSGNFDLMLLKLDQNGDTVFTRAYGDTTQEDPGISPGVILNNDYGEIFLISNSWNGTFANTVKTYVVKADSSGNMLFGKTYTSPNGSLAYKSCINSADSALLILSSLRNSSTLLNNSALMKIDQAGNILWSKLYYGITSSLYSVKQTSDGGYVLFGGTASFNSGNHGDLLIVKTDSMGTVQWTKAYGNNQNTTRLGDGIQTSDGGYLFAGYSQEFNGPNPLHPFLLKINANGDTMWSRWFGNYDYLKSIQETPDGGYAAIGEYGYLVKTDSLGHTWCNELPHNPLYSVNTVMNDSLITLSVSPWGQMSMCSPVVGYAPLPVTTICSSSVGIENYSPVQDFSVYPNPASNFITIQLYGVNEKNTSIRIVNMLGQIVLEKTTQTVSGTLNETIDVSVLRNGIYFFSVNDGGRLFTKLVVVRR